MATVTTNAPRAHIFLGKKVTPEGVEITDPTWLIRASNHPLLNVSGDVDSATDGKAKAKAKKKIAASKTGRDDPEADMTEAELEAATDPSNDD